MSLPRKTMSLEINPLNKVFDDFAKENQERKSKGLPPLINLGIGAPHLPVLKSILESLSDELKKEDTTSKLTYPPTGGRPETIHSIVKLFEKYYPKAKYTKEEVMLTMGATGALDNAFAMLLKGKRQSEVLVFEPYYTYYAVYAKEHDAKLVMIPTEDTHFRPSAKKLEVMLRAHPNAKVLVMNYPNNPSGVDLSESEMLSIVCVLKKYPNVAVIFDDVYRDFTPHRHITLIDVDPSFKKRCIMINSASKGLFGGPGIRVGFAAASADWIKRMEQIQDKTIVAPSLPQQIIADKSIELKLNEQKDYMEWLNNSKKTYQNNMNYFSNALKKLGFETLEMDFGQSGFYVLASAKFLIGKRIPDDEVRKKLGHEKFQNDSDIAIYLMHNVGIAAIKGSVFGIDSRSGYFRFSCAQPLETLVLAVKLIESALSRDHLNRSCELNSTKKREHFRFWSGGQHSLQKEISKNHSQTFVAKL